MARNCASCASPNAAEINKKLRSGVQNKDVSRWLTEIADPITPHAIGRHARDHLGVAVLKGPRPVSTDFLQAVVETAFTEMAEGRQTPTIRDAIAAQGHIDNRSARNADRDLVARIALALTAVPRARVLPPEIEAQEAEYRLLLESGN